MPKGYSITYYCFQFKFSRRSRKPDDSWGKHTDEWINGVLPLYLYLSWTQVVIAMIERVIVNINEPVRPTKRR